MLIRRATATEATRLTELARIAKASWGYPETWLQAWTAELTIAPQYITAHRVTVAEVESDVVGMCALERHTKFWMLEHVWIEPAWQRRGIGRALVLDALNAAAMSARLPLSLVAEPNAAGFYQQLGARQVAVRKAPMEGAADRVLPVMQFAAPL